MRTTKRVVGLAGIVALTALVGCAGISGDAKQKLAAPPDCTTKYKTIRMLEEEYASGFDRVFQGMQGVLPPVIVISLIRGLFDAPPGMYLDHWRVAFGSYNEQIETRIDELEGC